MREKWISHAASGMALTSLLAAAAHGATETVTAEVEFVAPITITENNPLQFGLLDVNMVGGETVTITPDDTVTDGAGRLLNGEQAPASLEITATAGSAISIVVENISGGTYYSLGNFQCIYDGATAAGCETGSALNTTASASATLMIGATLTGGGSATAGEDNGSFDVTVNYQ